MTPIVETLSYVNAGRAHVTAAEIGTRLGDRALVSRAVRSSEAASRYPFGWGGASLAAGPVGSALLLRELARSDPARQGEWAAASHAQLVAAVASTQDEPLTDVSAMSGSAGLLLGFLDALRDDGRYETAARNLAANLAKTIMYFPSWRTWSGVRDSDYDVVAGSSGVLVVLSLAYRELGGDTAVLAAAERLREDLEWLCRPLQPHGRHPWWITPAAYPTPEYLDAYPHGYVNLGTAHGIPGVLVSLSTAWACEIRGEQTLSCIRQVADYIAASAVHTDHGMSWPMGVPLDEAGNESSDDLGGTRAAWCYGAPGVASALNRAAQVLQDDGLAATAMTAAQDVLQLARTNGPLPSATLCHGTAGLVTMATDLLAEPARAVDETAVDVLTGQLLTHCANDTLLVVRDFEPPDIFLDSPGLLMGAAGVGLALLAAGQPPTALWRAPFGTMSLA